MPKTKRKQSEPTVITITLDNDGALLQTASLLIQRGELAKLMQIEYADSTDLARAIDNARAALNHIEKFPPQVPDTPSEPEQPQAEATPDEPTVDLPTTGDPTPIKLGHLKIVGGDTDAMAYRRASAVNIAQTFVTRSPAQLQLHTSERLITECAIILDRLLVIVIVH